MIKSSILFQLNQVKKPFYIFYAFIFLNLVVLLVGINMFMTITTDVATIEGFELASLIFSFVLGLNSFKETFLMFLQNGRSRKNLFASYLFSLIPLCGTMALIDNTLGTIGHYTDLFSTIFLFNYGDFLNRAWQPILTFIIGTLWHFTLYLVAALAGYMLSTFIYRLGRGMRIFVFTGVPVACFVILPLVDNYLTKGAIGRFLLNFIVLASGAKAGNNPLYPIGFCILFALVFASLSYLFLKGSNVKEPS